MFEFNFSTKKTISRNQETFPLELNDIKPLCRFYIENPTSEKYDTLITDYIIPSIVIDWERTTKFILLDTTIQAFIPNIGAVTSLASDLSLENLNVREVSSIKYYPSSWNQTDDKTTFDTSDYILSDEVDIIPIKLNFKESLIPLWLYPKTLNLEINYSCGYEENDFTDLPYEIKTALAMQVAMYIDVKEGLSCQSEYAPFIEQAYAKYSIRKQAVGLII